MRYLLLIPLLLCSCSTIKQIPVQTNTKDSVVVKELIKDTIILTEIVPQIVEKVVEIPILPKDTLSEISTSFAVSTAGIVDNKLHHRITNKSNIPIKVEYKDRIVTKTEYKEIEVPIEVIIEKKYIPNWCIWSLVANIIVILIIVRRIKLL